MKADVVKRWGALRALVLVAIAACPAHSAFALVKCVGSDGKVTFQDILCDNTSTSIPVLQRFGQALTDKQQPVRAKAPTAAPSVSNTIKMR